MIHERLLTKTLQISGPLSTCIATVKATLHEIEASIAIQNEGFENLVRGSKLSLDEVIRRATETFTSSLGRRSNSASSKGSSDDQAGPAGAVPPQLRVAFPMSRWRVVRVQDPAQMHEPRSPFDPALRGIKALEVR